MNFPEIRDIIPRRVPNYQNLCIDMDGSSESTTRLRSSKTRGVGKNSRINL